METSELNVALKEWAVVQRALLEGQQIILLRKGGLIEETGDFDLRAEQFFIYPTYEHETERMGDIRPCFGQWLEEEEVRRPGRDFVRIEAVAVVNDVIRVDKRERLIKFAPQHIWSEQFINGRFDWEPYKPVFVLLLRVYSLAVAHVLPVTSAYGGCRSWVTLDEPISVEGATPAISDDGFERRRKLTLGFLNK